MTDTKYHEPEQTSSQTRRFKPTTAEELAEAIELAFDYRGDVRLWLHGGETVEGYLFNRVHVGTDSGASYVEIFPVERGVQCPARTILCNQIEEIELSGEDTANGKSWEAWAAKKEAQRQVDAARLEEEARARGHL
ncbi:MAG: hypothetical protein AB7G48_06215 [Nitrospiraceae bacterium]